MRNFRNWEVWKNAKSLVKIVYQVTASFPDTEKFGLTNQIRRAAVSIPANIAEGAGRRTEKDFKNFLYIALGSAFELEALIDLSHDLSFIKKDRFDELHDRINHIQRQLNSFIQKL
ncbi:four helix bundle protein [Phaeodactylibacter xiamenensis]|uniref:four helix bundle protein n=1 Tax=Phaeodactylibacter xiamenensis TaxID=1524460 RepID=UPI0024A8A325|nr:four helix bundle protein [Phaeodactylibacter xiamenensis]